MERAAALKTIRRLLGDKMGYSIHPEAPTPDERAALRMQLPALVERRTAARIRAEARMDAVLADDAQYQKLLGIWKDLQRQAEQVAADLRYFKIDVGVAGDMFFSVKASGDSWEEIIDKLTQSSRGSRPAEEPKP